MAPHRGGYDRLLIEAMAEVFVVTGGSMSQRGMVDYARTFGCEVCVVDGSPSAPLFATADYRIELSFTDVEGVLAALREQELEPVAVATMGSDQAVQPTARLTHELGLPGLSPETAEAVSDKRQMRAAFEAAGVPHPRGSQAEDLDAAAAAWEELGPPVVVKPVDGSAQRGVTRVDYREDLEPAYARAREASRKGVVVVDQYLEGEEYTVNGFCVEGDYVPVTVTRRILHPPPPLGVCVRHRYPSELSEELEQAAFRLAADASRAVGLTTGPSYVQMRFDGDRPWVIEVGARLGGGKDAELGKLVTGFDTLRAAVLAALGKLTPEELDRSREESVAPHGQVAFLVVPSGRIVRLDAAPALALEGVHEAGFYWHEGAVLPPLRSGAERLGYVVLTAGSGAELDERTRRAFDALDIEIDRAGALV
jgi:cysteine synthase A